MKIEAASCNYVMIDGESLRFPVKIKSRIRFVKWNDTYGHIEYYDLSLGHKKLIP